MTAIIQAGDGQHSVALGDTTLDVFTWHPKATPKLLLDFGNVDHMSSAALGTLINVSNRVKEKNGQLRLANIKPQIFEVFVITKLNKLFRILPNRQEAAASFST